MPTNDNTTAIERAKAMLERVRAVSQEKQAPSYQLARAFDGASPSQPSQRPSTFRAAFRLGDAQD